MIAMRCRGQELITWHKQSLSTDESSRCRRIIPKINTTLLLLLLLLNLIIIIIIIIRLIIKYNIFFIITKTLK